MSIEEMAAIAVAIAAVVAALVELAHFLWKVVQAKRSEKATPPSEK